MIYGSYWSDPVHALKHPRAGSGKLEPDVVDTDEIESVLYK